MSNSQGWISLHRSLQDHPLWKGEPFTKGQAWVDLLLYANHKPARLMIKNTLINLDRGQQARSQLTLSKEWKWSVNKVKRFLKLLETDQMLTMQTNQQTTIITICNYSSFQDSPTTNESTNEEAGEKLTRNKRTTNNNVNNENNDNKNNIPYQLIADAYNDFAKTTGNPEVIKLTNPRKLAFKKLWNFDLDNDDVNRQTNNADYWVRYFNHCSALSFLNNSVERTGEHANWRPDFDFMVKEKTYIGVREGKYT